MNVLLNYRNDKNIDRIYFPELDGLRFFAFILVFIHHNSLFSHLPYLSILRTNGWIGVDLFFVLSAFLFSKLLIAENKRTKTISFRKFYIRRLFRIWPIYFLFIGFSTLVFYLLHGTVSEYIVFRLIGLFTFSDNIITSISGFNPMPFISHLWTIGYEEQFYVFIPIIIFLLVRSSFKARIISFFSALLLFNLIRIVLIVKNVPHPAIWVLPITHFESIIMGIVIGFGGLDFLLKRVNSLILGFISILLFILLCRLPNVNITSYWLIVSYSLIGISTSFLLYAVLNSNYLKTLFSIKVFVFLGKRSYGLYVYQLLGNTVAGFAIKHMPGIPSNSLASFLYSLLFTISISILSYKFLEVPFLRLKKKYEIVVSRPI